MTKPPKNKHAAKLGKLGGNARRDALTPAQRLESSRKAWKASKEVRAARKALTIEKGAAL